MGALTTARLSGDEGATGLQAGGPSMEIRLGA